MLLRFVTVSVEIEAKVRPPKLTVPDPWNPAPAWKVMAKSTVTGMELLLSPGKLKLTSYAWTSPGLSSDNTLPV